MNTTKPNYTSIGLEDLKACQLRCNARCDDLKVQMCFLVFGGYNPVSVFRFRAKAEELDELRSWMQHYSEIATLGNQRWLDDIIGCSNTTRSAVSQSCN